MPNRGSILKEQFLQSVASPWEKLLPDALVQELLAKEKITYYLHHLHTRSHVVGDGIPGTRSRQKFESSREADEYVAERGLRQVSFF